MCWIYGESAVKQRKIKSIFLRNRCFRSPRFNAQDSRKRDALLSCQIQSRRTLYVGGGNLARLLWVRLSYSRCLDGNTDIPAQPSQVKDNIPAQILHENCMIISHGTPLDIVSIEN